MARTYGVAHQWDGDLTDPHDLADWKLVVMTAGAAFWMRHG